MAKPLIGMTPQWDPESQRVWIRPNYLHSIERAGGVPVALPLTEDTGEIEEIARRMDGIVFTGGPDVHPSLYGRETLPCCGSISSERDRLELLLFEQAVVRLDKPCLGICRAFS